MKYFCKCCGNQMYRKVFEVNEGEYLCLACLNEHYSFNADREPTMKELAKQYQKEHRGQGEVTKVTDYSFDFTSLPDKNGNTKTVSVMRSYFYERAKQ